MNTNFVPKLFLLLLLMLSFSQSEIYSQEYRVILDENFSDWNSIEILYDDNSNDPVPGEIDFGKLKVTNYEDHIFFYLETGDEINLQDLNNITLYLDTDNNNSTGLQVNGIGAEFEYTFGLRSGKYYGSSTINLYQDMIGLASSPTVTSSVFEFMLNKNSVISGEELFPDSLIKIVIKNNISGGDVIPIEEGGVLYKFFDQPGQLSVDYSIAKLNDDHLRVLSYNVLRDNLFENYLRDTYSRIFNTLQPEIIGFQEIYNHTSQQTADIIEEFLPSGDGEQWYHSKRFPDIIVVSRFPIKQSFSIGGNGAFLIDMQEKYNRDLLLIVAHPPCCANNDDRQKEIDAFMAFIREAKEEGGLLTLEENTPIVIVGDMNLVGKAQQQKTLITGDIVNQNIYGDPFNPDWDGTDLADSKPNTTHMAATFTWYDEGSSFSPGRLDYIVYSNSVMELKNGYVLFTEALPQDSLNKYNLVQSDVTNASDHLPVISDFKLSPIISVDENNDNEIFGEFILHQNYPNPFNPATKIKYNIPYVERDLSRSDRSELKSALQVELKIYDVLGREVATLVNNKQFPGTYEVEFDATSVSRRITSGVYYYQLRAGAYQQTKKMLLLR